MQRLWMITVLALTLGCAAARAGEEQPKQDTPATETMETVSTTSDEIVVTATRTATSAREVGSAITVVTAEEIKKRQYTRVEDVLRDVIGLHQARLGGPGQQTSTFIRGAKSEHTLVLIDGIEVADPSLIARSADLRHMTVTEIERIEVLRGPQSTLYGSDSIGGVINIITKKGKPGKLTATASVEGGSYDTVDGRLHFSGGNNLVQFSGGLSRFSTSGFSAADEEDEGNGEEDGYDNITLGGRLNFTPSDIFDAEMIIRHAEGDYDYDNGGGNNNDDVNRRGEDRETFFRTAAGLHLFDGRWSQTVGVSVTDRKRTTMDPDSAQGTWPNDTYWGEIVKFDWQSDFYIHETNTLTIGAETEKETYEQKNEDESPFDVRNDAIYAQDQIKLFDCWFTTLGIRHDDHETFGGETTWRATSAVLIKKTGTKLQGSYGTGFKAPSLYQLYAPPSWGSPVGNEDLKPETSEGWDLGFEQRLWQERIGFGATYFRNDYEDLIAYDFNTGYFNRDGESYSRGWEIFAEVMPVKGLTLRLDYTHTKTWDKDQELEFARRPEDRLTGSVNYTFLDDRANVNLSGRYIGDRWDDNNNTEKMPDYTVYDLAGSYDLSDHWRIFGRVENLLDRDYQEVKGYGTAGRGVYVGIEATF